MRQTRLRCRRKALRLSGCWNVTRCAAAKLKVYTPAARLIVWLIWPFCWMTPTCVPTGADGLPEVKALPFPAKSAVPVKVQAEPVGSIL